MLCAVVCRYYYGWGGGGGFLAAVLCVVACRYCYGEGGGGVEDLPSLSHPTVGIQGWMGGGGPSYIIFYPYLMVS